MMSDIRNDCFRPNTIPSNSVIDFFVMFAGVEKLFLLEIKICSFAYM